MRRTHFVGAVLALTLALPLSACASVSNGTPSAADGLSGALGGGTPTAGAPVTSLQAQLLTLADLPSGWAQDPGDNGDGGGDDSDLPACLQDADTGPGSTSDGATVDFSVDNGLPAMEEDLEATPTAIAAQAAYAQIALAFSSCSTVSLNSDGLTFTGTVTKTAFPSLGDTSGAWRMTLSAAGTTLAFDFVVVAKGTELALLFFGALAVSDLAIFPGLVTKAVAKMP